MIWIKHEFLQKNAQKRFLNDHVYDLTEGLLYKLKFVKNGGTTKDIMQTKPDKNSVSTELINI